VSGIPEAESFVVVASGCPEAAMMVYASVLRIASVLAEIIEDLLPASVNFLCGIMSLLRNPTEG